VAVVASVPPASSKKQPIGLPESMTAEAKIERLIERRYS
jgi:hypothetical protein